MPTAPTYERQVRATPLPGVRRTPQQGGAGVGEAMGAFGAVAGRLGLAAADEIMRTERERADSVAELAFTTQLKDLEHQVLHSPDKGLLTKSGLEPIEQRDKALAAFDLQAGEIEKNLPNDRVKRRFYLVKEARRDAIRSSIDMHATAQLRVYEEREAKAAMGRSINSAIENADQPNGVRRVADELAQQRQIADRHAQALGLGPEATRLLVEQAASETHVGAINAMLAREQFTRARAYYEELQDQILPEARAKIEAAVQAGSLRGESQREADQILGSTTTESDAIARAKAIQHPELRDAVQQRVEHEWQRLGAEARATQEAQLRTAVNLLDQAPDIRRIPVPLWQSFSLDERAALKRYAEVKVERRSVQTDPATLYTLITMSTTPATRDAFLQTNLLQYVDRLSRGDLEQLMRAQGDMRQGIGKAEAGLLSSEKVQNDIVDEGLRSIGLDPTPDKKVAPLDLERVNGFRRAVRGAVQALELREGRKAKDEEVQRIADRFLAQVGTRVTARGVFSDTTIPGYAFELPQAQATAIAQVPTSERRKIEEALGRNGRPVSEAEILRLFNLALQRDRRDR